MARQSDRPDDGRGAWQKFAKRHKNSPFLQLDPIYAVPERLLDAVKGQAPGLLREGEERFERDLARTTAAGGFFHEQVFPCPLSPSPPTAAQQKLQRKLDALQAELMERDGRSQLQIDRHFEAERKREQDAALRAIAYTAWLVTDPTFREELAGFRDAWGTRVATERRFPAHRHTLLGEAAGPTDREEASLLTFYRRWAIETFSTFDLPIPMAPQVSAITYADTVSLAGAGLLTFVPWYALRDGRVTVKDLSKQLIAIQRPAHLDRWLARADGSGKRLGYSRLRHTLVVYRYWLLGLAARYRERLNGCTEGLDRAFARYLGLGEDSVKKVRLSLFSQLAQP
jgi:hypothetical protein